MSVCLSVDTLSSVDERLVLTLKSTIIVMRTLTINNNFHTEEMSPNLMKRSFTTTILSMAKFVIFQPLASHCFVFFI